MNPVVTQQISMMAIRVDSRERWHQYRADEQSRLRQLVARTGAEEQDLPEDLRWHLIYEIRSALGWTQVWLPITSGFVEVGGPEPEPIWMNLRSDFSGA